MKAGAMHGKVLLVDDDDAVRSVTRRMLMAFGLSVVDADSADTAWTVASTDQPPIDLLISDVVLGESTGIELAARMRAVLPALKVLLMSGYSASACGLDEPGAFELLQKPVPLAVLRERVSVALGADQ